MGNHDIFKKIIWDKTNGKCWYCGKDLIMRKGKAGIGFHTGNNLFVIEHLDGSIRDDINNLLPACNGCNASKGSRSLEDFRDKLSMEIYFSKVQLDYLESVGIEIPRKNIIFYGETL